MKNKIAIKLTLYFSCVLLLFALIIGGVFYQFFKQHTIEIKEKEMRVRANKIAAEIGDNMDNLERRFGTKISKSRFVTLLDRVSPEIVWVVDSDRNLSMNMEDLRSGELRRHRPHHDNMMPRMFKSRVDEEKPSVRPAPKNSRDAYRQLPKHIKDKVEKCFEGKGFVLEEYNDMLDGVMLTVGEPVRNKNGQIKAVLLLHSPVEGLQAAVWNGLRILLISLVVALALGVLISVLLSWKFTEPLNKMKNIAERLAERDYKARSNIKQNDEIGELAKTLDLLAERLQLADEESQKLEKLRREFIANISHELRTPVTVIRGSLEAIRDGVVTEKEDVEEFHEQMYNESIFLQRLINDLLDLSRLQNTDFPIEKDKLNLCDVIKDAVRGSRRMSIEKHLEIKADLDKELYLIDGDYGRLRQMLMIFLHNSIKFSPEGSSIEVQLRGNKLYVIDHGCGMPADDVEHAFERFYKARNEHNKSGSGLGLAISKQIALRHDMQVSLTSTVGEGTIITVSLPEAVDANA